MWNRLRRSGFTLIEMIVSMVVIGVGLAGVLASFDTTVKASTDPLVYKQMLVVAEEMQEEIFLKPYGPGAGTITGCNRSQADDIGDYVGYSDQPVCDIDGVAVPGLAGYRVSVTIGDVSLGSPAVPARRIEVRVSHGRDGLTLVGWRTDYAS